MIQIANLIGAVIQVFVYLIIARAIGSFFVRDWSRGLPRFLWDVTEPILGPLRRVLPPIAGLDWSPLVAIIGLQLLGGLLLRYI